MLMTLSYPLWILPRVEVSLETQLVICCSVVSSFGHKKIMVVEIMAIIKGVKLCIARSYIEMAIESDSQILFQMVSNDSFYSWHLDALIHETHHLLPQFHFNLNYIYRKANLPPDFLAKLGSGSPNLQVVFDSISVPQTLLVLVHLNAA
ncbi:hypothetical protein ACH5RR_029968 [Cinchona calisaya]|uniref:RNase H type-1 domain-containing protein n=1 Tax=Cinchona calisaya TaxID=153742 RepID=A0ABD2YTA8_9GENT